MSVIHRPALGFGLLAIWLLSLSCVVTPVQAQSNPSRPFVRVTALHSFSPYTDAAAHKNLDGANFQAPLTRGNDGNFYGVSYDGGANGAGTVFRVTRTGVLTTIYQFAATDGANPAGPLLLVAPGTFAGTTRSGGASDQGTVFKITTGGALPFLKSAGVGMDASYTVSLQGGTRTNTGSNYRYQSHDEQLSGQFGGLNIKGGYQYIGPYFSAPGYWGKVGSWTNPTNVRGPVVAAKYALTPNLTLKADAQFYKAAYGQLANGGRIPSPLQQDDRVTRYQVGLGYGLSSAYAVDLGYEDVVYDLKNRNATLFAAGKPHESYLTFGLGHSFNNNASLKLLYQVINYNDKGTGFDPIDRDGGIAVGQFQIKF